jgi:uncharacterized membrane protein YccC
VVICHWAYHVDHWVYFVGGLGQRYATIAFGALLIAIYNAWHHVIYRMVSAASFASGGAIWFNVLTLVGHLVFPIRPLQDNLARCYEQLSHIWSSKRGCLIRISRRKARPRFMSWL